jgi:hypothetical protein
MGALLTAKAQIFECMTSRGIATGLWEIVITVRCVKRRSPKYAYYLVDHANHTVRWLCGERQEVLNTDQGDLDVLPFYWRIYRLSLGCL